MQRNAAPCAAESFEQSAASLGKRNATVDLCGVRVTLMHIKGGQMEYVLGGRIEFDVEAGLLRCIHSGRCVKLQPGPALVLAYMVSQPDGEISRRRMLGAIGEYSDAGVSENSLNQVIARLRSAFREIGYEGVCIVTIPRIGYKFVDAVRCNTLPLPMKMDAPAAKVPSTASRMKLLGDTFLNIVRRKAR